MLILWKIRYLDRKTRQFEDRLLRLRSESLDPAAKAAVELALEAKSLGDQRGMLQFKHLFQEDTLEATPGEMTKPAGNFRGFALTDYLEDEAGVEISADEMARILTGSSTAIDVTNLAPHDIELKLSEPAPIPITEVTLSTDDLKLLGYFRRDLSELQASAFVKEGPGTVGWSGDSEPVLRTASTDEEIRSSVTIFRRLYMKKERANFQKSIGVFVKSVGAHRYGNWVRGSAKSYNKDLEKTPWFPPVSTTCTFTRRQLIDLLINSQVSHQPNSDRETEHANFLAQVNGSKAILTWLSLSELHHCIRQMNSIGKVVIWWFGQYCEHHSVTPEILNSLLDDHPGIGTLEKAAAQSARRFDEKASEIAAHLWTKAGKPAGGPSQFLETASEQLRKAMKGST